MFLVLNLGTPFRHHAQRKAVTGTYTCELPITAMQFDDPSKFVFLGDTKGNIVLLRVNGSESQFISKLSAHTG